MVSIAFGDGIATFVKQFSVAPGDTRVVEFFVGQVGSGVAGGAVQRGEQLLTAFPVAGRAFGELAGSGVAGIGDEACFGRYRLPVTKWPGPDSK